jgi:hypothetical protein
MWVLYMRLACVYPRLWESALLPILADKRQRHGAPRISSDVIGCHQNNPILAAGCSLSPPSFVSLRLQKMLYGVDNVLPV